MPAPSSPDTTQVLHLAAAQAVGTTRSAWVDISGCQGFSVDISWAAGAGGDAATFGVEVSNNVDTPPLASVAAIPLTLSTTPTAVSGATGVSGIDLPICGFRLARLVTVTSAGTFNLTALAFGKRLGGF